LIKPFLERKRVDRGWNGLVTDPSDLVHPPRKVPVAVDPRVPFQLRERMSHRGE
jgi:hypothetical protein